MNPPPPRGIRKGTLRYVVVWNGTAMRSCRTWRGVLSVRRQFARPCSPLHELSVWDQVTGGYLEMPPEPPQATCDGLDALKPITEL